jgi:hypothetical protein
VKTRTIFNQTLFSLTLIAISGLFFQSCSKADEVAPIGAPTYTITVKIKDKGTANLQNQAQKHLRIVASNDAQHILLDTMITGSFTYSFNSKTANMNVKATLTSISEFTTSLQIDANGRMHAYHNASCPVTEYEIADDIRF